MSELTFEKPGPGTWELEDAHFSKPFSRWMQEVFPPAMEKGFGQTMAHYGMLLDEPEIEPVNGFIYISMRPVVGPAEAENPPPKLLFSLMKLVHPALRRRFKRIDETFETKRWRVDLERWDAEWLPERVETNRSLQAFDPVALTDDELVDHLEEIHRTVLEGIVLHHRMDLCPLLPMGDFLAHAEEWTERPAGELLGLFDGASPISAGAIDELTQLADAIDADREARQTLFSAESPAVIIDRLRDRSDTVGEATASWLDVVGYRIVSGYDVADVYALEEPTVLVSTLRTAVNGDADRPTENETTGRLEELRNEVPAAHRDTFDELYEEARVTYRVRDERSLTDLWTIGLARRAILEVGNRLTERGLLHEPAHAVDLRHDELVAGLRGGDMPSPDEVAGYVDHRLTHDTDDAPATLGPDPAPPPPTEWLPEPAARGMRAMEKILGHMLEPGEHASDDETVRGLGASAGSYEGPARIVSGPDDFDRIEEGDVLVAETTSPAFNVVLPLLGGVVTDNGGVLSHAAIVAREYGIPGVVGCTDATDRLQDGVVVTVDGKDGTVRVQP